MTMKQACNTEKNICFKIIDILEGGAKTRRELIDGYILSLGLSREVMLDRSTSGKVNQYRSEVGTAINEMLRKGIIHRSADGMYSASEQKPVVIRNERCERLVLKLLKKSPMTKNAIRDELVRALGTDKTLTDTDDKKLFATLGEILRRLVREGIAVLNGKVYSLQKRVESRLDDIDGLLTLKESFLLGIHKRGGEFFESFFMTLLEKYVTLHGKTVIENTTTGGADDGGIDGIMRTRDCLGFRETVMVQTKNRLSPASETEVRGFWGAVCARQGSLGIFATTSGFHPSAATLLETIDSCVGVDGDMIFKMAIKTLYGIKKSGSAYSVDERII
ncbi:MAG: restriction endonuclease [Clostridia bacterium]|nr:restriction endonuclease [Clostridia bacterium]